jgi:hypothetical protein
LRDAAYLPLRKRRHFVARARNAEAVRDFIENIHARRAVGETVPLRQGASSSSPVTGSAQRAAR